MSEPMAIMAHMTSAATPRNTWTRIHHTDLSFYPPLPLPLKGATIQQAWHTIEKGNVRIMLVLKRVGGRFKTFNFFPADFVAARLAWGPEKLLLADPVETQFREDLKTFTHFYD